MQAETWKKVKQSLDAILALEPGDERARFLNQSELSPEVRREVESLLAVEAESKSLMQLSAIEFAESLFDAPDANDGLIDQLIGAYKIVRELGAGGMGAVYLAERVDGKFAQRVALKLLRRELNIGALRRRFAREREILSKLEHPNIARLLDAGTTDDKIPFLAMEYVEGLPITEFCDRHALNLFARLDLFCTMCAAIDFAHRNLIVHRDLKPSNILVSATGVPKLLDFGISKILSPEFETNERASTITKLGVMTPAYAAPEQLQNKSVTTAADVYSSGVVLYELLTGRRPFESSENDWQAIYRNVLETDPPAPSSLMFGTTRDEAVKKRRGEKAKGRKSEKTQPAGATTNGEAASVSRFRFLPFSAAELRGDLDNIVLKALSKKPENRYSSIENFAADIRRHQAGLPVTARAQTFAYRAEKFVQRNGLPVAATVLVVLAIIGGAIATLRQARIAQVERVKAERRFNDVRSLANSFLFEFSPKIENLPGSTPARELLVRRALEYLDNLASEAGGDADLQRELAAAYVKVGDVQGNQYNANLGDTRGALESYAKAVRIRRGLLDQKPHEPTAQSDLADVYKLVGDVHSQGGDYAKAGASYDQALDLRERIAARAPQDFDAQAKLANVVRTRGLIPFYDGDNRKAIEYYARAKKIFERLRAEQPDNRKIAEDYFYTFVLIGEAEGWDNDLKSAAQNLQFGLDGLIPLGEKYPNDLSLLRSVMLAHNKRAENHQDLKEFDKSVELFSIGAAIAQKYLKVDPASFQAKRDLAMCRKKLAQALDDAGKSRESLATLELALVAFQELARADPNNSEAPYDVANTRFSIGETYSTLKDHEAALAAFLKAKTEFETVLAANPNNYAVRMSAYNLNRLGKTYDALAAKRNRAQFLQNALECFQAAHAKFQRLEADNNFGEIDREAINEIETEIEKIKTKQRTYSNFRLRATF